MLPKCYQVDSRGLDACGCSSRKRKRDDTLHPLEAACKAYFPLFVSGLWRLLYQLGCERVSFSDPQSPKHHGSSGSRNDMAWNWLQRTSFHDDYIIDDEYVTSVAATAFAIHSLEQAELRNLQKMRERPESSRIQTMRRKEDNISRRPSETSVRSFGQDTRTKESDFPVRRPSGISSPRPIVYPTAAYQKQKGTPLQYKIVKTKPQTWEKAIIKMIQKQYEKMKSKILSWEFVKKIQAKLQKAMEMQRYQNKIARADMTAQGARGQWEHKRREGSEAREKKANKIRKTSQVPLKCLCFNS
ncbi:hypothetical protein VNO77_24506 [Canavalia gladiata]|uniref:Remorin C-terminal domain-containing protein n=1 Tax=Canavalia gladiata TaxID=3824 RepID=A0AAN9L748_CANGL